MVFSRLWRREDSAEKLDRSVERTRQGFFGRIAALFSRTAIDDALWDELEESLLGADVGVQTTDWILKRLRERVRNGEATSPSDLQTALRDDLIGILELPQAAEPGLAPNGLNVVLVVGVNGVGKTTTMAKLGAMWRDQGYGVILAGADTFRAAAIDQLRIWGERANLPVVAHQPGADPGAVVFDAISAATARGAGLVLVDTAGRLHTKVNLMEELKKIRRVVDRHGPEKTISLLVLDATTGQNAVAQAQAFRDAAGLDGLVITKLDGTARGGVVFTIARELGLPIWFVGTGETLGDVAEFNAEVFVDALLKEQARV